MPLPKTRAERFERIVADPIYTRERFTNVRDRKGNGHVPFYGNGAQTRFDQEIWLPKNPDGSPAKPKVIVGKSRKWGFTADITFLGSHEVWYMPGRIFRIVAHRLETSKFVGGMVLDIYDSFVKNLKELGEDPNYYLPRVVSRSVLGMRFAHGGAIVIDTAAGTGVGQADRSDHLYLTEYASWEHAKIAYDGLSGSQPVGSPHNRITVDFNAVDGWMGSECYNLWRGALKPHDDADWNGFQAFFAGIHDTDWYTEKFLDEKRRELGKRFQAVYPATIQDLYEQRDKNVHQREDIEASHELTGGKYLADVLPSLKGIPIVHGVDTATGRPNGDYQVMVSFGLYEGVWRELCEPLHERIPEDVFAIHVDERVRDYPGLCVVERNVGSAVLVKLRELETPNLYRHRLKDKTGKQKSELGFPTTYGTKRQMIVLTDQMLRDRSLGLVTPWLMDEFLDVEWYEAGGLQKPDEGRRQPLAGAPERADAHDDGWMGVNLAMQGTGKAMNTDYGF